MVTLFCKIQRKALLFSLENHWLEHFLIILDFKGNTDEMEAIHMISVWANQSGISLVQVKTELKSNEISEIPTLLDLLEVKSCITIDAMGCQIDIAEKSLKNNLIRFLR